MSRGSFLHAVSVTFAVWLVFVGYTCGAGAPLKENAHVGEVAPVPTVRIGLTRCLRDLTARVAVRGPWRLRGGRPDVLAEGADLDWTEIRSVGGGLSVGGRTYDEKDLTLVPDVDGTLELEYVRDLRDHPVKPTAVRYGGVLHLHALPEGKLALVNEVDLEEYLKGVVGKEMNLSEGLEALKTQVIAARTYAIHEQRLGRVRRVKGEKFDLYDDERSQVYGGLERHTELADRLVEETRGHFLVYEGRLVRAFYSSSCGGHTDAAWEVLQDETDRIPPLGGVKCGYCERRAAHKWKEPAIIPKKEIADKFLPKDLQGARVKTVEITKSLAGGRAEEVTISLENSSRVVKVNAAQEFKRQVAARLRSTLWDRIEDRGDAIAIWGRGYGHGAGLCQIGAYEMARDGKTAAEILEYYFPGAAVRQLY
jgi:stage II sporulation protein D